MNEIIVDNFAGGGGAGTGIEEATGRSVDIAINHDPAAIAMHKANHPETEHYCENVWDVDPREAAKGRPVGLAWFSPDCTHHSKARGGKPRKKNIRGLAWVAVRWAIAVKPRVIMLENVEEFKDWGPLDDNGIPIKELAGQTFHSFVTALKNLGYEVDWRELRACDYGAPTIRKRLFLIARCDGRPIVWPEPTHGDPNSLEVQAKKLKPWRTAAEIIDWTLPCPSIFDRKKPLAENTQRRIARGMFKFVLNNPAPFIVRIGHTGFGGDKLQYGLDKPLTTITTKAEHCLVTPFLGVNTTGHPGSSPVEPLRTVTTGGHHMLVTPFLSSYYTETTDNGVRGQRLVDPLHTITAGGNRFGIVAAFLAKHYGGNYKGPGASLEEPLPTITTVDHNALVTAFISQQYRSSIGHEMEQPLRTITTVNKASLVTAFLLKYYGSDVGQDLGDPLHTITTRDRFGLVTIHGIDYQIVDIGMRMLQPHELYAAQGFPSVYIKDRDFEGNPITKTNQVKMCGNSVSPVLPKAMVRANLPEMCVGSGNELRFERFKEAIGQLTFSV